MNIVEFKAMGDKQKEILLELLEEMRQKVEDGEIEEIVCASTDASGEVEIYVGAKDVIGAIGMFAVGQNILIQRGEGWMM